MKRERLEIDREKERKRDRPLEALERRPDAGRKSLLRTLLRVVPLTTELAKRHIGHVGMSVDQLVSKMMN